ncbi:hypothetical protein ACVWZ3_007621 [Bradyrhizobium sp. i1.3.6]
MISSERSRAMSSPQPAAKHSRRPSGPTRKTATAKKSPLENPASQTFWYSSSGDFAVKDRFVDGAQRCKGAREGRLHGLSSRAFLPNSPGCFMNGDGLSGRYCALQTRDQSE